MGERKEKEKELIIADRSKVLADILNPEEQESSEEAGGTEAKFGISIQNLTSEMANRLGLDEVRGVVVTSVDTDSFAEEIGMERGDVILELNHQPVNKVEDVLRIQRSLNPKSDVVFLIQRSQRGQTASLYLAGTLP